jgi:penicillin-binding protein 1A
LDTACLSHEQTSKKLDQKQAMHPHAPVTPPPRPRKRRKSLVLRFLGFAFTAGAVLFLVGASVAGYFLWQISQELPDYEGLAKYEPAVMTRVHANDGSLIGEFARQKRVYVPITAIPKRLINAFISAEDQNFYQHTGLDFKGIMRAVVQNGRRFLGMGGSREGASTITQQVAKNFFLTPEQSLKRKVMEALLAIRIERAFPKDKIMELYLNEIYFGMSSYGVAAASLNYFGKELQDLTIEECAYLAALPKAPNNYHPFRHTERAVARRNWVIGRMVAEGHIDRAQAEEAEKQPLTVSPRPFGVTQFAAEYFAEEVRRTLINLYGEDNLYGGGLSVRTTLDPELQRLARKALREGLIRYDRKQGYRGPVKTIGTSGDWGAELAEIEVLSDLEPWKLGVVLEASEKRAVVGLRPERTAARKIETDRKTVELPLDNVKWAREPKGTDKRGTMRLGNKIKAVTDVLSPGDVIYVAPKAEINPDDEEDEKEEAGKADGWRLVQIPAVDGAILVMDPYTGRVLADVGGFSFASSEFDRAIQAKRQPGSSFKPVVYATALDNGYTPSSIVLDAPLAIEQGQGQDIWKPENYENKFYGPSTLRLGLEKSRNLMTVRLAQDLGMPLIAEYSRRFNVYDQLPPLLSMALGAGETTLMRMVTAYSSFANGGKRVGPTLIDRIQDRYGRTIWRHDNRECVGCSAEAWQNQPVPELPDNRKQIIHPHSAYQTVSMLEGVVKRGTGYKVSKVGKPLAGKTGTTNDEKDAWFVGFSPDLVAGVFVGYDNPKPMGKGSTGGGVASPIFRDFMKWALADKPATPFRVPPGIKLVRIDAKTGMRAQQGDQRTILEAYKPNEEPLDPFSFVTYPGADLGGAGGSAGGATAGSGFSRQPQAGGLY